MKLDGAISTEQRLALYPTLNEDIGKDMRSGVGYFDPMRPYFKSLDDAFDHIHPDLREQVLQEQETAARVWLVELMDAAGLEKE